MATKHFCVADSSIYLRFSKLDWSTYKFFLDFTSQLRVRLFFLEEKKPKILEFKNVMIDEKRKQRNSLFRHRI